jgi:hypothetical protein
VLCEALGALPEETLLPLARPLVAVRAAGEPDQPAAGLGLGDRLERALEGLPCALDQRYGLVTEDLMDHLRDALLRVHGLPTSYHGR